MAKRKPEVLLIDGRNFVYRNGFTRRELSSRGRPTGAIYGCLSAIGRLHRLYPDASIVFCWDGVDASKSWRHGICADYKSNRIKDKTKESKIPIDVLNIRKQILIVEKLFDKILGFKSFSVPKLEADDLIGVLATSLKETHSKVIIYSTDRDFYQLVKENVVVVRDFDKSLKGAEITAKQIKKEYGVKPKDWLKFRAFVGDPGDRIAKPIRGIGGVKALKILAAGVDPSKRKAHRDYKEHWKAIRLAYRLSKIVRRVEAKCLPKQTKNTLKAVLALCKKTTFRKDKTQKMHDRFVRFLVDYDLEQILEHKDALWRIR